MRRIFMMLSIIGVLAACSNDVDTQDGSNEENNTVNNEINHEEDNTKDSEEKVADKEEGKDSDEEEIVEKDSEITMPSIDTLEEMFENTFEDFSVAYDEEDDAFIFTAKDVAVLDDVGYNADGAREVEQIVAWMSVRDILLDQIEMMGAVDDREFTYVVQSTDGEDELLVIEGEDVSYDFTE